MAARFAARLVMAAIMIFKNNSKSCLAGSTVYENERLVAFGFGNNIPVVS